MAQYTTDGQLLTELPSTLPLSLDTELERAPFIAYASALADTLVGGRVATGVGGQKFPDIDDTPSTPPVIEWATRKLAAAMIYESLAALGDETQRTQAERLFDESYEWFRKIRDGEIALVGSDGLPFPVAPVVSSTTQYVAPVFQRDTDGERDAMPTLDEF
jgi:hypothetical protein